MKARNYQGQIMSFLERKKYYLIAVLVLLIILGTGLYQWHKHTPPDFAAKIDCSQRSTPYDPNAQYEEFTLISNVKLKIPRTDAPYFPHRHPDYDCKVQGFSVSFTWYKGKLYGSNDPVVRYTLPKEEYWRTIFFGYRQAIPPKLKIEPIDRRQDPRFASPIRLKNYPLVIYPHWDPIEGRIGILSKENPPEMFGVVGTKDDYTQLPYTFMGGSNREYVLDDLPNLKFLDPPSKNLGQNRGGFGVRKGEQWIGGLLDVYAHPELMQNATEVYNAVADRLRSYIVTD